VNVSSPFVHEHQTITNRSHSKNNRLSKSLLTQDASALFVSGIKGTGKTLVLKEIFGSNPLVAWINSIECITPRILFERSICQWARSTNIKELGLSSVDSLDQYVQNLRDLFRDSARRYLIVENVEDLIVNVPNSFLEILGRLAELVHASKLDGIGHLCHIFESIEVGITAVECISVCSSNCDIPSLYARRNN
jgi:Cdc6-like AAA superfamily ATPase